MRRRIAVAAVLSTLLTLSACGDGGGGEPSAGGSDGSSSGPTTLKVGIIPLMSVAPIYLGIEKGFFEDEGLTIEPVIAQTGAAIVTSVLHGEQQIGFAATVPLITARSQNVKVRMIAGAWTAEAAQDQDPSRIFVRADSPIQSAADLAGKKFAVNALKALAQFTGQQSIALAGGDPNGPEYVALPFPNMVAALQEERVDAIFTTEPFTTAAEEAGARAIAYPYSESMAGATMAAYFASDQFIQENPDTVAAFYRALEQSSAYALEHPDEVKTIIPTYTSLTPELLQQIEVEHYDAVINRDSVTDTMDRMVELDYITTKPSLDELIHTP